MQKIPFVDLKAQYLSIKPEIDGVFSNLMENTDFIGGPSIKAFENAFAHFLGMPYFLACANGTDSIEIILKALEIGPGDEVLVPAHSWFSTSEAVGSVGATPVFVDVKPLEYTINPVLIEQHITPRTKAIIPVHLCGLPCDMDEIMSIAGRFNLWVIEDCAQSHGALYKGKLVGTFGVASSFSFYPGKNLGAYGDAGGIATADSDLLKKMRMIANHGQLTKHHHQIEGRNSRMDTLHAGVLLVKLPHLNTWNQKRGQVAALYKKKLSGIPQILTPVWSSDKNHVFHLFIVQVDHREDVMKKLGDEGIATAIHYPKALPFLEAYSSRNFRPEDFPVAFSQQDKILSLPIYPELTEADIDRVCNALIHAVA